MLMTEVQKSKVTTLRTEMEKLDLATYQDIRESYYQIADNLRPLVDALEKADAELGPDGRFSKSTISYVRCSTDSERATSAVSSDAIGDRTVD